MSTGLLAEASVDASDFVNCSLTMRCLPVSLKVFPGAPSQVGSPESHQTTGRVKCPRRLL